MQRAFWRRKRFIIPLSVTILLLLIPFIILLSHPLERCGERLPLPKSSVTYLLAGIVAQEDHFFFRHSGVEWQSLKYLLKEYLDTGEIKRGASTIDMQVVSLCYFWKQEEKKGQEESTKWVRKLFELYLVFPLNIVYPKEEILLAYVHNAPLIPDGGNGFIRGAEAYFKKKLAKLSEEEVWTLIVTLRNRNTLNPSIIKSTRDLPPKLLRSNDRARERQKRILRKYGTRLDVVGD